MSTQKEYWKGLEELNNTPGFVKNRDNEFSHELPIDAFLGDEKLKESSTSRRDFLKFLGFSVTAASLVACEAPVIKSIPYVAKPEDITPGVANWYASTYYDGNDYASILVKTREGRPIFIKGNRKFGINKGTTVPRVTASVLSLYDTARLQGPLAGGAPAGWDEVDTQIKDRLAEILRNGGQVRFLTGSVASPSTESVLQEVQAALAATEGAAPDSVRHIQYDPVSYAAIREANQRSFGQSLIPDYDFSKARVIVSIAADFLTNWLLPTQFMPQYLQNRKPENEWMSRHFQFESILTVSGANADSRVPIKPSQEGLVAAALYQHITGTKVAEVPQEILDKTKIAAAELKKAGSASVVVAGANNPEIQVLVNAINENLGAYSSTINLNNPVNLFRGNDREVEALVNEVKAGKIDALFIDDLVNPVYSLPEGKAFGEALSKVKLTVSFSRVADETASLCQFVCPNHHYLESWNDLNPVANHYALVQPAIRPLYETRALQESLLVWIGKAQRTDKDSQVYYDVIRANWEKYGFSQQNEYLLFEDYWNWHVHNGSGSVALVSPTPVAFAADVNEAGRKVSGIESGEFELVLYQNAGMGIGNQAANPWLQELPDPITKVTWDNYLTMSPADMQERKYNLHIGQEDPASLVTLKTESGAELELPVFPQPGQARGTIGLALGYGRGENGENIGKAAFQHKEYGGIQTDGDGKPVPVGKNAFKLASFAGGLLSYHLYKTSVSGTGKTYPLASTQTHHTIMGRTSVVRETTFAFYKTGQKEGENGFNRTHTLPIHENGEVVHKPVDEVGIWKEHPIKHIGHRWGMTIDLNTCIGCGNCLVACQAENNVPVVGKDEVRRGREMHWLRLDRYYSSDMTKARAAEEGVGAISMYSQMEVPSDSPEVVFMPMMCQQCNHAPCETVCPVAATTHSDEGLNQMAYNRCIGTRYCANNCPYKVRRFNWFNYPSYKKFTGVNPAQDEMGRLVLNPDVVVRTRGVMEKCSMCVQEIQAGKLKAKKEGRKLVDGDIDCACADACPTDAITFGDWNDEDSAIRKVSQSDRAYHALEETGVKPNIWYMVKVRNTVEQTEA